MEVNDMKIILGKYKDNFFLSQKFLYKCNFLLNFLQQRKR